MLKRLLTSFLLVAALTTSAVGAENPNITHDKCTFFSAEPAIDDHEAKDADAFGRAINLIEMNSGMFQLSWSGLTGTINATAKLQVSTSGAAGTWIDKAGGSFTITGASGTDAIVLTTLPEAYYNVVYTSNGITGGTITGKCTAKQ